VHGLPSVLQVGLSGVQVPPEPHFAPQHWASLVHAPLSAVHWVLEHTFPMQLPLQQSVPLAHDVPAIEHVVGFAAHVPFGSQIIEQQLASLVQPWPNVPHTNAASELVPPSTSDPCLPPHAAMTRHASVIRSIAVVGASAMPLWGRRDPSR
jgi:hypothetical protein